MESLQGTKVRTHPTHLLAEFHQHELIFPHRFLLLFQTKRVSFVTCKKERVGVKLVFNLENNNYNFIIGHVKMLTKQMTPTRCQSEPNKQ